MKLRNEKKPSSLARFFSFGKMDRSSEVAARCAALLQIFLVIFFRAIEGARRRDFRCDRPLELSARFQRRARLFGNRFLLRKSQSLTCFPSLSICAVLPTSSH